MEFLDIESTIARKITQGADGADCMLTIAYITSRKQPMIEWFFDSLHNECGGDYAGIRIVVVDVLAEIDGRKKQFRNLSHAEFTHVEPKPTVWSGSHRITRQDYWSKCNSLNTAICYAPDGWVTIVDDLAVLAPGWLHRVRIAIEKPTTCTLGAFKKLKDMDVVNGCIVSATAYPKGIDSRCPNGQDDDVVLAAGDWMYGHVTAPLEAFLRVNGYPECLCDSLSFEDVLCGMAIQRAGYRFVYDRKHLIYESEELHHVEGGSGKRFDKGVTPNDKSHAALSRVINGDFSIWNNYDLRELRKRIQKGDSFPLPTGPTHDWYDRQPLTEL